MPTKLFVSQYFFFFHSMALKFPSKVSKTNREKAAEKEGEEKSERERERRFRRKGSVAKKRQRQKVGKGQERSPRKGHAFGLRSRSFSRPSFLSTSCDHKYRGLQWISQDRTLFPGRLILSIYRSHDGLHHRR